MSSEGKPFKKTPKVIQLTEENSNPASANSMPARETAGSIPVIQGLKLVGSVKEKGFSLESDQGKFKGISVPEPRVTPFPKARHRSEGPHWAPITSEPTEVVDDTEDAGAESLAAHARPIERKNKKALDFSNRNEKLAMVKPAREKSVTSEKKNKPTPISCNEVGKQEDLQGQNRFKCDKSKSVEVLSESSEISFTSEQRKEGPSAGITEKPGELVPLSREADCKEDAGHSSSIKSDDIVTDLNRLQVRTESDTMKKVIKDNVERAHNYKAEREGLKPMTDMEEIDAENRAVLQAMSADEIEGARSELLRRLRPETVEMLKRRGTKNLKKGNNEAYELNKGQQLGTQDAKKISDSNLNNGVRAKLSDTHSSFPKTTKYKVNEGGEILSADLLSNQWKTWTDRVEAVRTLRFSLDGNIVNLEENAIDTRSLSQNGSRTDADHFSAQNVAERDILRTDGDPAGAGYTLKEAAALVRSMVPGQRAVALQLIGAVLDKALANFELDDDIHDVNKSVDWQAVWSYALGPEPGLVLTLRMALDDSHSTVVLACVKVLQCLLSFTKNEHYINLSETFWAGGKPVFLAPVFRRRTMLEEGFLGGGFWKYSAKPSNMFPFLTKNIEEDNEEEATVADDTTVAGQDVAAGLIRMGILPRIRYILEVDQLAAAEEPCLSVIISLARHSPTAADAIMKCPRLLDTITQRYIIQQADLKVKHIQVKAVHLLKVLCEANRSNCVYFVESGVFQSAERHLFCHYTLDDWLNMGQETFKSTCAVLVEELRLWKVCIEYGLCVSCFPDFYPALCFWLSPPSEKIIGRNIVNGVLDVARESFVVLEALARTLPNLHSVKHGEDGEITLNGAGFENWSWNQVVPMVEVALEWLNLRESPFLLETLWLPDKHIKNTLKQDSYRKSSLGVISVVIHALSSIFEKILPLEDISFCSSDEEQSSGKWSPVPVPQVGLKHIESRLLHFSEMKLEKIMSLNLVNSSFLEYLCFLRKESDYETSLSALSCFHGIIRLIALVDNVMNFGQRKNHAVPLTDEHVSDSQKVLKSGLVVSSQNELKCALNMFMDLVSSEWHHVQSTEVNGRGGPAPGIGLGWGATDGGFWSRKVLLAQADATVTVTLLELFPIVLEKDVFDLKKLHLQTDGIDAFIMNTIKKINAALSIVLILGPKDMLIIEKVLNILLTVPVMEFLSIFVHKVSREETKESTTINIGDLGQADYDIFSKVLLLHFKSRWLRKKKQSPKNGETKKESKSHFSSRNSRKRPPLGTVCEESTELGRTPVSEHSLGVEWARQRLPVPVQWLLSPLSTSILEQPSAFLINNVLLDSINSTDRVFNTVRSGLFFLLGLEVIFSSCNSFQSSPILCIPLVRKIHILSVVFVNGGDLFLETPVRDFLGALQELYGQALDRQSGASSILMSQRGESEKSPTPQGWKDSVVDQKDRGESVEGVSLSTLNFERDIDDSYQTFIDTLIQHFAATSFGDVVYGRQVTIYLHRGVEASIRLATWNALANDHILELLPPLEQCFAHPKGYLFPPEDHEKMIEAYVSSWVSGALDKAAVRMSLTFSLALHHIASFIFIGDHLSMRKKVARNLLLDSSRKPDHQVKMSQLLKYNALDRFQEHGNFRDGQALSREEIMRRSSFLLESCEGDSLLLAEVQKIQTAV